MCGLAGIVRYDRPATAGRETLAAMQKRLAHRGPDAHGVAFGSFSALAHVRLAMVDAARGAQPFASADGRHLLVYDGELYNHNELRARLPGPWRTDADTETLLAAWMHWGEACLEELDGMFAFFVWDERAQAGYAARDRLGVKPFAYTLGDHGELAFASEAQALIPALGHVHADVDAIVEYLVAPAFSGVARSPFANVRYLQPGHVLRVDRAGVTIRRYWRWSPRSVDVEASSLVDEVRAELETAVGSSLRSDFPLGVFASGGLDSTAVAAIARRSLDALPAFTIAFDGQDGWLDSRLVISDDTPFARRAAAELDLDPREIRFDARTLSAELAEIARVDDALPAWEQELSQRALARAAAGHVKGVLVGDAADETHYGYHFLLDDEATATPATILGRLGCVPVHRAIDPRPLSRLVAEYDELTEGCGSPIARTTRLVMERWLPRLLHNGDIHCMAFGLEARVPFAATGLIDVAMRVAPALALRGGVEKWVLREALRGTIPEPIRTRRKSALPKDQGSSETYRAIARRVLEDPHPIVREIVDAAELAPLLDPARPLQEPERAQLFRVICLHHWAVAHGVAP